MAMTPPATVAESIVSSLGITGTYRSQQVDAYTVLIQKIQDMIKTATVSGTMASSCTAGGAAGTTVSTSIV